MRLAGGSPGRGAGGMTIYEVYGVLARYHVSAAGDGSR